MGFKETGEIREYSMKLDRHMTCPHCEKVNDLKEIFDSPNKKNFIKNNYGDTNHGHGEKK